jgi:hypothetical protein
LLHEGFGLVFFCPLAAEQKFEVVSIKPVLSPTPETIRAGTYSSAFRIPPQQMVAPDFARGAFFDIQATLPEGFLTTPSRRRVPRGLPEAACA